MNDRSAQAPHDSSDKRPKVALRNSLMVLIFLLTVYPPCLTRPPKATPVNPMVAEESLPNFHVVEPYLWRGAAPNVEGVDELKRLGVKTIVDLRRSPQGTSWEGAYAITHGLRYINVPMGNSIPTLTKQRKVLAVIDQAANDPSKGPVFLHCSHGSDRTGFMVACWRVQHDKRSILEAFTEMMQHGFFVHKWQPNNGMPHRDKTGTTL
jgi:protein tyrosine phosphatase (PTP) superfamily phosphohydrolase (DUF442 family)